MSGCEGTACVQIRGRREAAQHALRLNDENAVLSGRIETMKQCVNDATIDLGKATYIEGGYHYVIDKNDYENAVNTLKEVG